MAGTWPWPWDGRHGHPLPPLWRKEADAWEVGLGLYFLLHSGPKMDRAISVLHFCEKKG